MRNTHHHDRDHLRTERTIVLTYEVHIGATGELGRLLGENSYLGQGRPKHEPGLD